MATVDTALLQEMAQKHLWLHFTQMAGYDPAKHPVMVRGEDIYLHDSDGNRYMDFLSGLFTVQIGYSYGEEIGQAMLEQAMELPYYTNWTYSHPKAIELATKLAEISPDSIDRSFFVSGGSEGVEGAIKLARSYHNANGEPTRRKVIARKIAYHGTTYGALSLTGITSIRAPFEPLMSGVRHVSPTNPYRCGHCADAGGCNLKCAEEVAEVIEFEDPSTVSMVIMEPVQNAGGCFTPHPEYHQRVGEICKEYGVLHAADETICGYGRLGEWYGSQRFDYQPDIITCAKGLTSGYQPMGAVMFGPRIADKLNSTEEMFLHGITFGGHPIVATAALKNLEIMEREGVLDNVRNNQDYLRDQLLGLKDRYEIIGDVRGAGYFWAMELVKDRATKESFSEDECNILLRDTLSPMLIGEGLLCRADDRGDPAIQISPPLITTRDQIDEAISVFDKVLPQVQDRMAKL